MQQLVGPVLALAMFTLAGAAYAQSCQPTWVNIPCEQLPRYPYTRLYAGVGEEGPGIYAFGGGVGSGSIYFWNGTDWVEIPRTGIPGAFVLGEMRFFDQGSGSKAYLQVYQDLSGGIVQPYTYCRVQGVWQQQSSALCGTSWMAQYPSPMTSADLGDGPHIYGVVPGQYASVCKWTGATWDVLAGSRTLNIPGNLIAYDSGSGPSLYAISGQFRINGATSSFARFNPRTWSWDLPTPTSGAAGEPNQAVVYDWGEGPRLICAGAHYDITSTYQATVSMFDGTGWTEIGAANSAPPGETFAISGPVAVYDDGPGPGLYFIGDFGDMNHVPANNIARWDGHSWEAVPGGATFRVTPDSHSTVTMNTPRGRALVIAGGNGSGVSAAGGNPSLAVMYIGCPTCYANCDASTTPPTLNIADFLCFLNAFARRDPYANCNNDASFDAADFMCFMNRFAAGCP
jgi:hypothetical protein